MQVSIHRAQTVKVNTYPATEWQGAWATLTITEEDGLSQAIFYFREGGTYRTDGTPDVVRQIVASLADVLDHIDPMPEPEPMEEPYSEYAASLGEW